MLASQGPMNLFKLWKHGLLGFTKVITSTTLCWPEKNWQLVRPPFHTFMKLQNMVTTTIEMHYSHPINLLMILVDFAASSIPQELQCHW